ncbi:MAG TPA: hypothetical protein VN238_07340 [Solirubrobacteraceae bacterium]|nr:hypothetical protein [Solirubrobacteraceae bacterium]
MFITHVRIFLFLALGGLAFAAPAAAAQKERARSFEASPHLWATVNICDSDESPDTIGVRASMPGTGREKERMFMRFRVQYRSETDGAWRDFADDAGTVSEWVSVGRATFKARQSGWSFPFELEAGQEYELRAVASFEWRRGEKVVRKLARRTTKGHKTALAEPKGYSAATCVISG